METDRRVLCPLYGIFMFVFMGHLFFLLKISCAFLEVGVGGEVERKIYFTISLANLLSGLESLPTVGLSTGFPCPFLDVLTNIFQPRPFLF